MKKAILVALSAMLLAAFALALTGCGALEDAAALQSYDFGEDIVPSVNSVVGERKVTGVSTGTSNGGQYKEYQYESATVSEDLIAYVIQGLIPGGWIATVDFNLNVVPGSGQIAIESEDEGKILLMDLSYENGGYTIRVTKIVGTLTRN
ncbi:MAG: hypothetical protein LBU47_00010 [Christensenellaceae bacterium]|jgi:hypothetical protein|nr:hypothetical protein [Christensenellaceae bacterium]